MAGTDTGVRGRSAGMTERNSVQNQIIANNKNDLKYGITTKNLK
jgi:hypothetical protein